VWGSEFTMKSRYITGRSQKNLRSSFFKVVFGSVSAHAYASQDFPG